MWVAIKIRKSTDEGLKYAEQSPAELDARGVGVGGGGGWGGGGERREGDLVDIPQNSMWALNH